MCTINNQHRYFTLTHTYAEEDRQEANPCAHCGARVYLEGMFPAPVVPANGGGAPAGLSSTAVLPAPVAPTVSASAARAVAVSLPLAEARPPPEKRRRLATEIIRELQGAKELLDSGHISQGQFEELKCRLFADE